MREEWICLSMVTIAGLSQFCPLDMCGLYNKQSVGPPAPPITHSTYKHLRPAGSHESNRSLCIRHPRATTACPRPPGGFLKEPVRHFRYRDFSRSILYFKLPRTSRAYPMCLSSLSLKARPLQDVRVYRQSKHCWLSCSKRYPTLIQKVQGSLSYIPRQHMYPGIVATHHHHHYHLICT